MIRSASLFIALIICFLVIFFDIRDRNNIFGPHIHLQQCPTLNSVPKLPPFLGPTSSLTFFAAWGPETNGDGRLPTHPNDDAYAPTNPPFCLLPLSFDFFPHLLRSGHRAVSASRHNTWRSCDGLLCGLIFYVSIERGDRGLVS